MKFRRRYPRFTRFSIFLLITLGTLALFAGEAAAGTGLHRVGPLNPAPPVGNFPAWYQDNTGLTLEFCDPKNDPELDGGWCLLTRNNVPPGAAGVLSVPEFFPTNFFDEHFYYSTSAVWPANPLQAILWEAAIEAAFSTGGPVPGAQITFARIRVRLQDVPVTGTYRFIHPYGEIIADGVAGGRIFVTEDVGVAPGNFTGALDSNLGPFLLPSNTPGGAEMPPLTEANPTPDTDPAHFVGGVFAPTAWPHPPGTDNAYIADPARRGPVTGSILGPTRNKVRIEGPAGSNLDGLGNNFIETINFTLVGRIFTENIISEVTADRADYARNAAGRKVGVFATGFGTAPARLPAQPIPVPIMPQLSFFDAPCGISADNTTYIAPVGATETQMFSAGNSFWAQIQPATIPLAVCVKDNVSLFYFPKNVVDEVTISEAFFDNNANTLSVKAFSGDEVAPPTLTMGGFGNLTNGSILVAPLAAPPSRIRVLSSFGGTNELQVTTTPPPLIEPPPVDSVTLAASPVGTTLTGNNVIFTALASGGFGPGTYEYQFWKFNPTTGVFDNVTVYGPSAIYTWNTGSPTVLPPGIYEFQVFARSVGSTAPAEAVATRVYTLTVPLTTSVDLTAAPASPVFVDNDVLFTAENTVGGTATHEYQFWYRSVGAPTFSMAQDYGAANTFTWKGTMGSYEWQVFARSTGSTAVSEAVSPIVPFVVNSPVPPAVTGVTINASPVGTAPAGDNVTFIAAASGGSGTYEYQFMAKLGTSGTFGIVRGYSTDNTWIWNSAGAPTAIYEFAVYARSVGSIAPLEAIATLNYTLTQPAATAATGVTLTANPANNAVTGSTIVFTAAGSGGTGPYEYQFGARYGSTGAFGIIQDYSASNTFTWSSIDAPATGYEFQVNVRVAGSTAPFEATATIPYVLNPLPTPTSATLTASPAGNTAVGNTVVFTAAGIGGSGTYQYAFLARFGSTGPFGDIQGYGTTNTYTWDTTGAPTGGYEFMVLVRNVGTGATFQTSATTLYTLTP